MDPKKLSKTLSHIRHVQENCHKLGLHLIEQGDTHTGIRIIQLGQIHDASKLSGIELEHLVAFEKDDPLLPVAIRQHVSTQPHHPEYWPSAGAMPTIYAYEMAMDLLARSQEFGTCVWDYIHNVHMVKYHYSREDELYKDLQFALQAVIESWN